MTDARVRTGTKSPGKILSDLNLIRSVRSLKGLRVGVDANKVNTAEPFVNHADNRVAPAAANSHHTDLRAAVFGVVKFYHGTPLCLVSDVCDVNNFVFLFIEIHCWITLC